MRQDCATHFLVEHASIFYKIIARGLLSNNGFQLAQAHSGPKPAGANSPTCNPVFPGMLDHWRHVEESGSAWNCHQASRGSDFWPWRLARFAVGRMICSLLWKNTKRTRVRHGRAEGKASGSSWNAHQASQRLASSASVGMGGFKGKRLVLRGMLITPHKGK